MSFLTCIYYYNNQHRQDLLCKFWTHTTELSALLTFTSPTSVMDKSETPGGTGVIVPPLDTRLHNIYKDIFHPPIPWSWSQLVVSNFVHMYWELRSPVSPGLGICYAVYSHIITPWDRSIRSSSADLADLRNGNQWQVESGTARDQFLSHHQESILW